MLSGNNSSSEKETPLNTSSLEEKFEHIPSLPPFAPTARNVNELLFVQKKSADNLNINVNTFSNKEKIEPSAHTVHDVERKNNSDQSYFFKRINVGVDPLIALAEPLCAAVCQYLAPEYVSTSYPYFEKFIEENTQIPRYQLVGVVSKGVNGFRPYRNEEHGLEDEITSINLTNIHSTSLFEASKSLQESVQMLCDYLQKKKREENRK